MKIEIANSQSWSLLAMLDNKAAAISASYNTVPNQRSSTNGTATVGFHQVGVTLAKTGP